MSEEEEKIEPEVKEDKVVEITKSESKAEKESEETPKAKEPEKKPKKAVAAKETPAKEKDSEKKTEEADQVQESPAGEKVSEKKEETAADLLGANIEQVKVRKAKGSKNIASGICFIVATFNNTKVSFSDMSGNIISWSSSGKCNFRGSRKSTAYAAQVVTQDAGRVAMSHGMKEVLVKVKGPGMGRDSAIRALQSLGFIVSTIIDVTPVPHNGCRPPKRRRV
tara:strand:- start:162 stop:830 length:669 start_codon:yes stop_codon:yes gene_type:complete